MSFFTVAQWSLRLLTQMAPLLCCDDASLLGDVPTALAFTASLQWTPVRVGVRVVPPTCVSEPHVK